MVLTILLTGTAMTTTTSVWATTTGAVSNENGTDIDEPTQRNEGLTEQTSANQSGSTTEEEDTSSSIEAPVVEPIAPLNQTETAEEQPSSANQSESTALALPLSNTTNANATAECY